MIRKLIPALFVLVLSVAALPVAAQSPVSWSLKGPDGKGVKPGDSFNIQLSGQISGDWHLYSITQPAGGPIPTKITLPADQPFTINGAIKAPRPNVKFDPNFQINTETHSGSVAFTVPVKVSETAAAGSMSLGVNVRFQVCNDTTCLPPKTVKVEAPVLVALATASAAPSPTPKASPSPSPTPAVAAVSPTPVASPETSGTDQQTSAVTVDTDSATGGQSTNATGTQIASANTITQDQSLLNFIWLAMVTGALALLTPCVFPMVPITVSYFTGRHEAGQEGNSHKRAVVDASIYALGMILTFTALGVALAIIFGAAGINKFASNPWVNLVIAAIFISFALSLFGAYNLGVPSSVLTKLDNLSRNKESSRVIGLLLMGLTFSLTSFTCTAPFVGTLLVMAAQGDWLYPVIGMLAFSSVFSLPFFVLALAPQLVSQLPRSGGWLNSVKVVMGLLEVAAAMKFLSNVDLVRGWNIFTREVVLASWVAIAVLITVYLLGKFQLSHDAPTERIGAVRMFSAIIFLSLGFYLLTGLFGHRLGELESFLPPRPEGINSSAGLSTNAASGELEWMINDYDGALKRARAENKLVLVDFTGYTCTNCRWMEANMFPRETVKREMEKFVRVRLYTDGEGELYERQQQMQQDKFGTVALPFYAVVDANGNPVTTFPGLTRNQQEFVAFLENGAAKEQGRAITMNTSVTDRTR